MSNVGNVGNGNVSLTTFTDSLTLLRQALADADPLAALAPTESFSATAETVAAAFASAPNETRQRFLLRALDDAIAAIEVAARLTDELHLPAETGEAAGGEADALQIAYRAFAESQTTYQALYQYRNVLATRLKLDERPIPEMVSTGSADTGTEAHTEPEHTPSAKQPRSRSRKPTAQKPS
jgi:hypothetical protein